MISLDCPAKINLFLEVLRKRADGYHDLSSVFLAVDLIDKLTVEARDDGKLSLTCTEPGIPLDKSNLVIRAADALRQQYGVRDGAHFHLEKRIPSGAGLGGGSSNAAAALRAANTLWQLDLDTEMLAEIGAGIGSDVPFFLHGGTALCEGRGERITPLSPFPRHTPLVLVLSALQSNTGAAYAGLQLPSPDQQRTAADFIQAMENQSIPGMENAAFNRFEPCVFHALPQLRALSAAISHTLDRPLRMSGSGTALWFFGTLDEAQKRLHADPICSDLLARVNARLVQVNPYLYIEFTTHQIIIMS